MWLIQNQNKFDYFVELDLQEIVGYEKVLEWRGQLRSAGLLKKCITVYHGVDGWDKYEKLIEQSESRYIGIEGLRQAKITIDYLKHIKHAYDNKVRIHGFAFTRSNLLEKLPFYSVDSSSWKLPTRYGKMQIFREGKLKMVESKKEHFFGYNILLRNHKTRIGRMANISKYSFMAEQYDKLEKHYTELWEGRGVKWIDG